MLRGLVSLDKLKFRSEVSLILRSDSDANAPVSMSELLLYRFASGVFLYQLVV